MLPCSPPAGALLVTPNLSFSCCFPLFIKESAEVLRPSPAGPSQANLISLYLEKRLYAREELKMWALEPESTGSKPGSATCKLCDLEPDT